MFNGRFRLPSPALVIAMIALALVIGGTAGAATTAAYLTKASGTKLVKKLAPTLTVKNAAQLGGTPAGSYERTNKIMWAVITNNGSTTSVVRSSPGVFAVRHAQGEVYVTFPRDVSDCVWTATQGSPAANFVPGEFATVRGNGTPTQVYVVTYDTAGAEVDANFHILVVC